MAALSGYTFAPIVESCLHLLSQHSSHLLIEQGEPDAMRGFRAHKAEATDLRAFWHRLLNEKCGSRSWPGHLLIEFTLDRPLSRFPKKPIRTWGVQRSRELAPGVFCHTLAYYERRAVTQDPFSRARLWEANGQNLILFYCKPSKQLRPAGPSRPFAPVQHPGPFVAPLQPAFSVDPNYSHDSSDSDDFHSPVQDDPVQVQLSTDQDLLDPDALWEFLNAASDDKLLDPGDPPGMRIVVETEKPSPIAAFVPKGSELAYQLLGCIPNYYAKSLTGRCVSLVPQKVGDSTKLVVVLGNSPKAVARFIVTFPTASMPSSATCNAVSAPKLPTDAPLGDHRWMRVPVAVYGSVTIARVVNPREARKGLREGKKLCIVPFVDAEESTEMQAGLFKACSMEEEEEDASVGVLCKLQGVPGSEDETSYEQWEFMLVVITCPSGLSLASIDDQILKAYSAFSPLPQSLPDTQNIATHDYSALRATLAQQFELTLLAQANNYTQPERRLALSQELLVPMLFEHIVQSNSSLDHESLSFLGSENIRRLCRYQNSNGHVLLHFLAAQDNGKSLVTRLYSQEDDPNVLDAVTDDEGRTPLFVAAWNGQTEVIDLLVQLGSRALDFPDREGKTPFFAATWQGYLGTAERMIELGSQAIDMPANDGCTPMHHAANRGLTAVIEMLVRAGSKALDSPDREEKTPLHLAVTNGFVGAVNTLVQLGSMALDTPDKSGSTPLLTAARKGKVTVIRTLVQSGSQAIDTPDKDGKTPMHEASHFGHESVVETLLELGSQAINSPDRNGMVPKELAALSNNKSIVDLLEAIEMNQLQNGLGELQLS